MAWEDTAQVITEDAEHLTKVIQQLILKRQQKIPELINRFKQIENKLYEEKGISSPLKGKERKAFIKKYAPELWRTLSDLSKESDHLNRSLGEIYAGAGREKFNFLNYADGFSKEKNLFNDVLNGDIDIYSEEFTKKLHSFETKISGYTEAVKSGLARYTVGHHQHLSSLRDLAIAAKAKSDPTWWNNYTKRLKELGYDVGDLGIVRIDPITHKPLQNIKKGVDKGKVNVLGFLGKHGITADTPGFEELYAKLQKISAHADGTISPKIPALYSNLSVDKAVELSLDYLDVEKARSQQGVLATKLLQNWSERLGDKQATAEDFKKISSVLNRIPELDLDNFLKKRGLRTKVLLEQLANLNETVDTGIKEDRLFELLEKKSGPVKRSWIDPKLLSVGTLSTSALIDLMKNVKASQLISPFIGPEDLLDENVLGNIGEAQTRIEQGEPWLQVAKEEGADIATGFRDQLLTTGGMFTAMAGLSKLAPGAAAAGGTALGWVAPPLLAIGAWKGIDAYQEARGKKTLTQFAIDDLGPLVNAAKEGDALTSIPSDNTLGSSLKENKISGGGLVQYQTGTEWTTDQDVDEEATPTYDYAPSLQFRGV